MAYKAKWNDRESMGLFEAFCKLMSALKAAEAGGGRASGTVLTQAELDKLPKSGGCC